MSGDRRSGSRAGGARAAFPLLVSIGACLACLQAGCGRDAPVPAQDGPAPAAARPAGRVRVILPRGTPQVPFRLDLAPEMVAPDTCRLDLQISSSQGGMAEVEFFLDEGMVAVEGELRRAVRIEPEETRTESLTVSVPPAGHRLAAGKVTLNGRRAEAYAEFGESPTAEERGVQVRRRATGERVLRLSE